MTLELSNVLLGVTAWLSHRLECQGLRNGNAISTKRIQ